MKSLHQAAAHDRRAAQEQASGNGGRKNSTSRMHRLHKHKKQQQQAITSSQAGTTAQAIQRPGSLLSSDGSWELSMDSDGSLSSISVGESATGGDRRSTASNSSSYIGANGKVAPNVLKQIAGFNQGACAFGFYMVNTDRTRIPLLVVF